MSDMIVHVFESGVVVGAACRWLVRRGVRVVAPRAGDRGHPARPAPGGTAGHGGGGGRGSPVDRRFGRPRPASNDRPDIEIGAAAAATRAARPAVLATVSQ